VNAGKIEKTIVEGNDISEWMLPFQRNDILNIRDIEQGLENPRSLSTPYMPKGSAVTLNPFPPTRGSFCH
ncbi:putative excision nuclease UvrA, partial [Escherichia coli T234_00]